LPGNVTTAKILGYAGLIPFVIFSIASWISLPVVDDAVVILIAYAAVILTFIGAVHWGVVMSNNDDQHSMHLLASVVPSLVAWIALLIPVIPALIVLLLGFIIHILYDWSMHKKLVFPEWYLPMRVRLTSVVSICLVASIIATGII
jgi:hypothetical protein